ncbi:hypothetical protein [Dyadobacter sp. 32]|uniref:hypothetical protein n=1 Tax=Dyadobacter sp. 32 TaxID=538966 RepID=UPI0011F014B7
MKIAEPTVLTSSGCSGGIVQWSTGETGPSITVKPLEQTQYLASCTLDGQELCSKSIELTVDNLPPDDIECPPFTLTAQEVSKCLPVTITPHGCPESGSILWENLTTTSGTGTYSTILNTTKTIRATCTTQYGQQVTSEITVSPLGIHLTVSPNKVYAGAPFILRGSGCINDQCKEGVYRWKNMKTGQTFTGPSITATIGETTDFEVSCDGGWNQIYPITAETTSCDVKYSSFTKGNATNVEINASWCNPKYEINWYKNYGVGNTGRVTVEYPQGRNKNRIAVARPQDTSPVGSGIQDNYIVHCINGENPIPCNYSFSVESPYLLSLFPTKSNLTGTGSTGPQNTPEACNEFLLMEKGGFDSPRSASHATLYSDWCPGTKVEWFTSSGNKLGVLTPPSDRYSLENIEETTTYKYKCHLKSGKICENEYTLVKSTGLRIAAAPPITSTVVDEQCSNSISLATAMKVYYEQMLCQNTNLYTNNKTNAEKFVDNLITALKLNTGSSGVKYPENLSTVIDAMVAGDCKKAAALLSVANEDVSISVNGINSNILPSYDQVQKQVNSKLIYQTDGHYSTVYLIGIRPSKYIFLLRWLDPSFEIMI